MGWNELVDISHMLDKIYDCTIVGFSFGKAPPLRNSPLNELEDRCDIVIEFVDSNFWEISVKDKKIRKAIIQNFGDSGDACARPL